MILYSNGCPKCNVIKKKLEGVDYYEVEPTETDIEMLKKEGFNSLPVLLKDGKLYGFRDILDITGNCATCGI